MLRVGLVFVAVVAAVFGRLKWHFWEPTGFQRDSWAFRLKVDESVKSFPLFSPESEPAYSVRVADGVKPSVTPQPVALEVAFMGVGDE